MKRGIIIGVVCGLLIGILGAKFLSENRRYTVQVLNQVTALKTDTKTGKTWLFNLREKNWQIIPESPPKIHKPDIFDQLTATNPFSDIPDKPPQHPNSN